MLGKFVSVTDRACQALALSSRYYSPGRSRVRTLGSDSLLHSDVAFSGELQ
jgi:hypothetical protein